MLLILIIYFGLNLANFCNKINNKKIIKIFLDRSDIYFETKKQILNSSLILVSFVVLFVLVIRILRIFISNKNTLDLKVYYYLIWEGPFFLEKLVLIAIFFFFFFNIKKSIFRLIKFHYFKIHYYYFVRYTLYNNIIKIIRNNQILIYNIVNENKVKYIIIYIFFYKAFKYIVFLSLFKNILFDYGVINIRLLLYYGLYKFFLNIVEHITKNFVYDFEQGVIQYYFPDEFCITPLGMLKINLYLRNLICEKTKYEFIPNAIFDLDLRLKNAYPVNLVFFSSYYSHIDIYELLKKKTPRISEEK